MAEKQFNKSAWLKRLNKKKAAAKAATKSERPSGIADDMEVMKKLGLEKEGDSITVNGRVSKITPGDAKNDPDRPYIRFAYNLSENSPLTGKGKGQVVSNYHELCEQSKADGEVWREEDEAFERMYWEFQSLGEDTKEWSDDPFGNALEAAERHTKDKTPVSITLSRYKGKKSEGMNVSVRLSDEEYEDVEEEEEESTTEESSEESSEEEGYESWIGAWVKWEDDEGAVEFKIESYDEENDTFSGKDADGDEWTDAPCDSCEPLDPQPDEE